MRTLKLGFALDGNSDYPVIPVLCRRLIQEHFPEIPQEDISELRPRKTGHGFVRELPVFARQLQNRGVDIIVAIVDTDNTLINERRRLLREAQEKCRVQQIPACIADGLAVRAMETWLLADETALFAVFDGDRPLEALPAPENDPAPKDTLNRLVRILTDGEEVTFVSFARELAEAVQLRVLQNRCPHCDEFATNILNCVREWQRFAPQ